MGKYTWIKKHSCSIVDYVIGSSDLFKYIHNIKVNDHTPFSDHNIIELSLPSIQYNGNITKTDFEECVKGKKITWSNECIIQYQEVLQKEKAAGMIDNMYARLNNCHDITAINDVVHQLTSVLQNAADPICGRLFCMNNCCHSADKVNVIASKNIPVWMCKDCNFLRNQFYDYLQLFRNYHGEDSRERMVRSRNVYISHTRRCRRNYDQLKTEQLDVIILGNIGVC